MTKYPLTCLVALAAATAAAADSSDANLEEVSKQLSNPIAALMSVPFQLNYDAGLGADGDGEKYTLNVQPVIPISVTDDWNLISRTILPLVHLTDFRPSQSESGTGDVLQSGFLSPKRPTRHGLIWGIGAAILAPTASEDILGSGKWAAGPTAVALMQQSGWTFGILANHLRSFAGDDQRREVDATFVQPFVSRALWRGATVSANTESTYDWEAEQWTVPLNVSASQVVPIAGQLTSFSLGYRYYLEKPAGGPDWGLRLSVTLLFPL